MIKRLLSDNSCARKFRKRLKAYGKTLVLSGEELDSLGVDKVYKAKVKYSKRKLLDRAGYLGAVIITFGIRSNIGYFVHFYLDNTTAKKAYAINSSQWLKGNDVTDIDRSRDKELILAIKNKDKKHNLLYYFHDQNRLVTIMCASDILDKEKIRKFGNIIRKRLRNPDGTSG
jgi:hypothetical protein